MTPLPVFLSIETVREAGLDMSQRRLAVTEIKEHRFAGGFLVGYSASSGGAPCGLLLLSRSLSPSARRDLPGCTSFSPPALLRGRGGRMYVVWERDVRVVAVAEVGSDLSPVGPIVEAERPMSHSARGFLARFDAEGERLEVRYEGGRVLWLDTAPRAWPRGLLDAVAVRIGPSWLVASGLALLLSALFWLVVAGRARTVRSVRRGRRQEDLWTSRMPFTFDLRRAKRIEVDPDDQHWTALGAAAGMTPGGAYREGGTVQASVVLPGSPATALSVVKARRDLAWALAAAVTALAAAVPALAVWIG